MIYIKAKNSGVGFIKAQDRINFQISGYPADIWIVEDNKHGQQWAEEQIRYNEGQYLEKADAQSLVNDASNSVERDVYGGDEVDPTILP
jgi:hypothetical protein